MDEELLYEGELVADFPGYVDEPESTDAPDLHLDTSGALPVERLDVSGAFDSAAPATGEPSLLAVVPGAEADGLPHWVPVSALSLGGGTTPEPSGPGIVTIDGAPVTIGDGVVVIGVE